MSTPPTLPPRAAGANGRNTPMARNAPGSQADIGWKHGINIPGPKKKIQCKFCEKIFAGGVYRLKHHLAGTSKDVGNCNVVTDDVRKQMWDNVVRIQENLIEKTMKNVENVEEVGEKRKSNDSDNIFKKRGVSTQTSIKTIFLKSKREDACKSITRFIVNNAIAFNVSRSDEYHEMCEDIAKCGSGFKPPSIHEIRNKYLPEEVKSTNIYLEEHKAEWKRVGCTIMCDGWTDTRRRTLINFCVNSPKGTVFLKSIDASHITKTAVKVFELMDEVVEEVGEENIIQIVTDNAANYKAAGDLLMAKRKRLYWTPCAAHCLDLVLEDFEKKVDIHKETIPKGRKITVFIYARTSLITLLHHFTKDRDLVRHGKTRFATSYLTLGSLLEFKDALMRMFTSKEWKSSMLAKTRDGKGIENVVMDKEFWKGVVVCLKGAMPIVNVLRMVDSDQKPAMGFIYEAMDQAKENIQKAFKGVKRSYLPIWDIVDERWDKQLHRPLHAAGFYLNPEYQYVPGSKTDAEVKRGLYDCLTKLVRSDEEQSTIDVQFDAFRKKEGLFGSSLARLAVGKKTPADWWESYGDECPELKRFAIRILGLTCSSSGCERNWSAFEMVHTKRRNRLKQKTMNDIVFVMANSKLAKRKKTRKPFEYNMDDLEDDCEWVQDCDVVQVENVDDLVQENIFNDDVNPRDVEDVVAPLDEEDVVIPLDEEDVVTPLVEEEDVVIPISDEEDVDIPLDEENVVPTLDVEYDENEIREDEDEDIMGDHDFVLKDLL